MKIFFNLRVLSLSHNSYHLCSTNTSDRKHLWVVEYPTCAGHQHVHFDKLGSIFLNYYWCQHVLMSLSRLFYKAQTQTPDRNRYMTTPIIIWEKEVIQCNLMSRCWTLTRVWHSETPNPMSARASRCRVCVCVCINAS
jgi:hypothetical protein